MSPSRATWRNIISKVDKIAKTKNRQVVELLDENVPITLAKCQDLGTPSTMVIAKGNQGILVHPVAYPGDDEGAAPSEIC